MTQYGMFSTGMGHLNRPTVTNERSGQMWMSPYSANSRYARGNPAARIHAARNHGIPHNVWNMMHGGSRNNLGQNMRRMFEGGMPGTWPRQASAPDDPSSARPGRSAPFSARVSSLFGRSW
jgi:hypothetical protein